MKLIIQFQSMSLNSELAEYFSDFDSLPTSSALCQQRNKLDVEAFSTLFYKFIHSFHHYKTLKGYHLLACDGSDINISFDPLMPNLGTQHTTHECRHTFISMTSGKELSDIRQMTLSLMFTLISELKS